MEGISLNVAAGEFVSLVGPSGCGKSTVLRLIAHMVFPSTGTVQWLPGATGTAPRAGFVFQHPHLLPWRDVLGNIALPLELSGMPARQARAAAVDVCDLVNLDTVDQAKLPRMLSGGMQMRVSLARALVRHPALMLMDEPFAAIDDLLRQQLNTDVLRLWQEQGWTCLFVTHHLDEALFMAQRVVVMSTNPGAYRRKSRYRVRTHAAALADLPGICGALAAAGCDVEDANPMNRTARWLFVQVMPPAVMLGMVLAVWELIVWAGRIPPLLLPGPSLILRTLVAEHQRLGWATGQTAAAASSRDSASVSDWAPSLR